MAQHPKVVKIKVSKVSEAGEYFKHEVGTDNVTCGIHNVKMAKLIVDRGTDTRKYCDLCGIKLKRLMGTAYFNCL